MLKELLSSLGLNSSEAEIYLILLQNGEKTVKELLSLCDYSRTNLYNILVNLEQKGLISQLKKGAKNSYAPLHPNTLEKLVNEKESSINNTITELKTGIETEKTKLSQNLPSLISEYNLSIGKPGIQFYEGKEGIKAFLEDSLNATETILSYLDPSTIDERFAKINEDYKAKRYKAKIKKKILVRNSEEYIKRYKKNDLTDVRFIDAPLTDFKTVMQIYNNKISYLTLQEDRMIAVIIEDELIANMHKELFNAQWQNAKNYSEN
jgi:sugar-specific transcriptional regulator TrmB